LGIVIALMAKLSWELVQRLSRVVLAVSVDVTRLIREPL